MANILTWQHQKVRGPLLQTEKWGALTPEPPKIKSLTKARDEQIFYVSVQTDGNERLAIITV